MLIMSSPLFSLFLPPPVNIYITTCMFVRYLNSQAVEGVGLIVRINAERGAITLRRFMSWVQLCQHVGHETVRSMSFWPIDLHTSPPYLCDTDVIVTIPVASIQGLAFVFYVDDPVLPSVRGNEGYLPSVFCYFYC
jgi:hypothetical protein